MKTLICTVGLPRSGKSTWSRTQLWPIVNPDSIRLALHGEQFVSKAEPLVWLIADTMVKALFLAGHDVVILDATNVTHQRRDKWISPDWETMYKLINTPAEICIERAKNDLVLIDVIKRMATLFEPLGIDEKRYK